MTAISSWLLADIGGTNVRFAIQHADGRQSDERVFQCADYPDVIAAIRAYFSSQAITVVPQAAAFAVAGPPDDVYMSLTNQGWTFYTRDVCEAFGFSSLKIINDFTAVALAVPELAADDVVQIGSGTPKPGRPIVVLGPGTGLGVSTLVPANDPPFIILTNNEGGHFTIPPMTARESDVLQVLREHFNHVSAERVISGPGLLSIYQALCALDGVVAEHHSPAAVAEAGLRETHCLAHEAIDMFCAFLGTAASNVCITVGGYGGVYLAGGILPKFGAFFFQSRFRKRFETKGRFSNYLETTPTYMITHPLPAMLGLKAFVLKGLSDTSR